MIFFILAILSLAVIVILLWPIFKSDLDSASIDEKDYLAADLADIENEIIHGEHTGDVIQAARVEASRRLLAEHRSRQNLSAVASPALRQFVVAFISVAPVFVFALYFSIGNPSLSSEKAKKLTSSNMSALAPSAVNEPGQALDLVTSINNLEQKLSEAPNDLNGWVMLAESYASLNRFEEAAIAFNRAAEISPQDAFLRAAQGEALTMANGGIVNVQAEQALNKALEIDSTEPRATFYIALKDYQSGNNDAALLSLVKLRNDAPDNAAWIPIVEEQIAKLADELGRDIGSIGLSEPIIRKIKSDSSNAVDITTNPSQESASGKITELENSIRAGTASYDQWLELAKLLAARNEIEKAQDVIERAKVRYKEAPFVLQEISKAEKELFASQAPVRRGPSPEQMTAAATLTAEERQAMIENMVSGLASRLEQYPNDIEGWMMLGRSYGVLEEHEQSVNAYARVLELDPENISARVSHANAMLARLDAKKLPIDAQTDKALKELIIKSPGEPFALYFLGVSAQQKGDSEAAKKYWEDLVAQLPEGSAELEHVMSMIESL